jgi:hypothetical protein
MFSAYEKSRKWSKGHAQFWGIQLENLEWNNLSDIILTIKLEDFKYPLQLPVENTQIKDMILEENIKQNGTIQLGKETGEIQKINLYGKDLTFPEFYDYYINETQELNKHTEFYNTLIPKTPTLDTYTHKKSENKYTEDKNYLYKNNKKIHTKKHNQYTLTFMTNKYPQIKPTKQFTQTLHNAIFQDEKINLTHVGEQKTSQPIKIGNLNLYNQINIDYDFQYANQYLLNQIQNTTNPILKTLLKKYYCTYWIENIENNNLKLIFTNIIQQIIEPEIQKQFQTQKIEKDKSIKFEPADAVNSKPQNYAHIIKKHVKKCIKKDKLLKYIILYGIDKKGHIKTINNYNTKNLPLVENLTNQLLKKEEIGAKIKINTITLNEGIIINIFIIPLLF